MNKNSKKKREKKIKITNQRVQLLIDTDYVCVYIQNKDPHKSISLKEHLSKEYYNPKKIIGQNLDRCVLDSSQATWYY